MSELGHGINGLISLTKAKVEAEANEKMVVERETFQFMYRKMQTQSTDWETRARVEGHRATHAIKKLGEVKATSETHQAKIYELEAEVVNLKPLTKDKSAENACLEAKIFGLLTQNMELEEAQLDEVRARELESEKECKRVVFSQGPLFHAFMYKGYSVQHLWRVHELMRNNFDKCRID